MPCRTPLPRRERGKPISAGAVAGDTLERAIMEEAPQIEFGESFARTLTETTQSLVCVLDRQGRILLFNEACERATGYRREEVLGRLAQDCVIPSEEREAFSEFLAFVWRTGTS